MEIKCSMGELIANRENARIATDAINRLTGGSGVSMNEIDPLKKAMIRVNDSINDSCDCLLGRD